MNLQHEFTYIQTSYDMETHYWDATLQIKGSPSGWRKKAFDILCSVMQRFLDVSISPACRSIQMPKSETIRTSDIHKVIKDQFDNLVLHNETPGLAIVGYKALDAMVSHDHLFSIPVRAGYRQQVEDMFPVDIYVWAFFGYEIPVILTQNFDGVLVLSTRFSPEKFRVRTMLQHLEHNVRGRHTEYSANIRELPEEETERILMHYLRDIYTPDTKVKPAKEVDNEIHELLKIKNA